MRGFENSLVRSFGAIVVFDRFGADPFFREEFGRGAEEVMEESLLLAIEVIQERNNFGMI